MFRQDKIIDDWNNYSDEYFSKTKFDELFLALEKDPYKGFPHAMAEMIKEYYPDLKGKNICVPSCGDNTAVFGFCALGANVTATDISYKQIESAQKIAKPTFTWRIQDYVNSLIKSGFAINGMEEFHSVIDDIPACSYLFVEGDINHDGFNWHKNLWAALQQCLGLCSEKV